MEATVKRANLAPDTTLCVSQRSAKSIFSLLAPHKVTSSPQPAEQRSARPASDSFSVQCSGKPSLPASQQSLAIAST